MEQYWKDCIPKMERQIAHGFPTLCKLFPLVVHIHNKIFGKQKHTENLLRIFSSIVTTSSHWSDVEV